MDIILSQKYTLQTRSMYHIECRLITDLSSYPWIEITSYYLFFFYKIEKPITAEKLHRLKISIILFSNHLKTTS